MILGFWNFVYTFLMEIPRDVFGFIATAPAVAAPASKNKSMIITRQLMILGFWIFFLYTYLMILFKDILDLLQPRQRLPPSLQKLIYDHNSAINDHGLQNIFVHFSYEIIPRYFELITTASAAAALTSKNGSMIIAWQQMILGFWNFVYTSLRKIPKYFGLITTAPAVAASPF